MENPNPNFKKDRKSPRSFTFLILQQLHTLVKVLAQARTLWERTRRAPFENLFRETPTHHIIDLIVFPSNSSCAKKVTSVTIKNDEISRNSSPSLGIGFGLCPFHYSTTIFGFFECGGTKQSASVHEQTQACKSSTAPTIISGFFKLKRWNDLISHIHETAYLFFIVLERFVDSCESVCFPVSV